MILTTLFLSLLASSPAAAEDPFTAWPGMPKTSPKPSPDAQGTPAKTEDAAPVFKGLIHSSQGTLIVLKIDKVLWFVTPGQSFGPADSPWTLQKNDASSCTLSHPDGRSLTIKMEL